MKNKILVSIFIVICSILGLVSFVSAETSAGISLDPSSASGSACMGQDAVYQLRIINNTPVVASFSLSYASVWSYEGPTVTPLIAAGGYWPFEVRVRVPWSTYPGGHDTLTLSASGGGYTTNATITTSANFSLDWADYSNAPRGSRFLSVVYYDGRLYKIGGDVNNVAQPWLDIYNIGSNSWSQGANMPEARSEIDCEAIAGKIYCAGGFISGVGGFSTLYIYNIGTNTWSTGANLPYGLYSYASASLNGLYYVIGGRTTSLTYSTAIFAYNPYSNTWDQTLTSMATGRRYHSAGVINGKIYVTGGYNGTLLTSTEVYDPILDNWTSAEPLPAPRVHAADGVSTNRFLILAGGSSLGTFAGSDEAMIYDAVTNTWQWIQDMDHRIYGAEGESDGSNFWIASGQAYIDTVYTPSLFTTMLDICDSACGTPVSGVDFTWTPTVPLTNSPVTFTATVGAGVLPITYAWDFDDGSIGTGSPVQHIYTSSATYQVFVTASNCDGANSVTTSHNITVAVPPTLTADQTSIASSQIPGTITTQNLELCNQGDFSLNWTMTEADALSKADEVDQINAPTVDLPWLSESPTSGTIQARNCTSVTITYDSTTLADGVYQGFLKISSNDPINPLLNIPVSLSVAPASIELVNTVGLVENTCGATDVLITYPSTTVYYCFTVTNTGGTLLNLHNLVDDTLGNLLVDYYLDLPVGTSFSMISNGFVINNTTTNESTWSASISETTVTDTDTTTVTVIPSPDVWIYLPIVSKVPAP